jgi:L-rhamnose mutarotase
MQLDIVYISDLKGKPEMKVARASGFLEKSQDAEARNTKAIADVEAGDMFSVLDAQFDSSWRYVNTEFINAKWNHHYLRVVSGLPDRHVWLMAKHQ